MKKYLIALLVGCCAVWSSCSDENKVPDIRPVAQGEFTDERDGNTYGWIRIGDLEWMTSNLKYAEVAPYYECQYNLFDSEMKPVVSHSLDFDFEADYEKYGNLYTWEEANTWCPEGWRLPSDEDWQKLEMELGMSKKEAGSEGWRGKQVATLLRQGEDGLGMNLFLSGCVMDTGSRGAEPFLSFVEESGYYWTSSENKESGLQNRTVWFRKIFSGYSTVCRNYTILDKLMRVRCCRDAGK